MHRFKLIRDHDVSGVSGTGHVANGVVLDDDTAVVKWLGDWPTVTLHTRGVASVEHIHCHGGATRIVWIDDGSGHTMRVPGEQYREQRITEPTITDPVALQAMAALGQPKPNVITCQVYEDGHERWSDEPTEAERIDVANVRLHRAGFRGIITLDRGPKNGQAVEWEAP